MNRHTSVAKRLGGLLIVLSLNSTAIWAQWDVSIFMQPFPPPYLSDWENNPTIGSLTITNNTASSTDVVVNLTLSRNTSGVIATGNSNPIATSPGVPTQVNSDRFIDWNTVTYNTAMRDQAIQTGRLPEGEYNACVTVRDMAGSVLASNVCAPFTIVYPAPPSLFFPAEGDSLDSMYPLFTWTPVQVPPAYQLHYILRIVEILPSQTPHQALLANIVQYEDNNLLITNTQYPISALPLEPGKTYAWQVQAVDQNGFPPSSNQGRSEIWTFVMRNALSQTPTSPTPSNPLFVKIVRHSTGPFSDLSSSSFESVAQRLTTYNTTGGTVDLPLPVDTTTSDPQDTLVTIEATGGFHVDHQKRSWAVKGRLWGTGPDRAEVLLAGVWGSSMDLRRTVLAVKNLLLLKQTFPDVFDGLTGNFLIVSLGDFGLKPADLPDSVAGFIDYPNSTGGDTTVVAGFFGTENSLALKTGLNMVGKFDLHRAPRLTNALAALGVEHPYVKLKGFIGPKWEWAVSSTPDTTTRSSSTFLGMELSAEIPITRESASWLPELNAQLAISYKHKFGDTTHTLTPRIALSGKVTFPFLRSLNFLNDTIKVTGSIEAGLLGPHEVVARLGFDDIIKFERFENLVKVHDPKISWNITKWWQGKGGVTLEAAFDFLQITNVGTVQMDFIKKKLDSAGVDSNQVKLENRRAGVWQPVNPETRRNAGVWAATNPVPLKGAKPPSQWKPKVTLKFDPIALASLGTSVVLRTALLVDNLLGDVGNINELARAVRFSGPAPNPAPPEMPEFLNNLPALDELSISFRPGSLGSMVLQGKTRSQNSSTEIIVARAESPSKKGFIFGLKPQNWSIRNYFPNFSMPGLDNLTLSNVALVFSNVEGMMPSSELSDEEFEFYSAAYGSDDFTVVIKDGLNLIASIPGENLGSNGPLVPVMEKLGVERGGLLLQGSLGTRLQDIYLLAVSPSMQPPGAPSWFRSGEMAIELTGQPSIGLVGALTVTIEGDDVTFLLKTKASPQGLILAGGMASLEGWESPFGIEWLTLNRVMMLLGVTPAGSVQLGFNADMVVGTKDIDVAVLAAISPAGVPTNFMFDGESDAGFGVSDLVTLQQKIAEARSAGSPAIPLDNVPPLYIKNAKLKFAPKDSPELNITRGMTVGGLLQLKPSSGSSKDIASALLDIGDEGIIARGNIGAFSLGPVKLQEAALDLTLTRSEQYCILTGQADLGFMNAGIDMNLTKTSAFFHAETRIFNAFEAVLNANGVLNITQPAFVVHAKMKNDFNGAVAQQLRQALKDAVTSKKNAAKSAADEAERKWQSAVDEREAAKDRWASLPLLPRNQKVDARKKWEAAIAKALRLRAEKELKEGKERRWTLASTMLSQLEQQTGSGNFIVVRKAEFEADLANLKTGAVKKMAIEAKVGEREMDLQLSGWNFKNMGASVKSAAQNIADELFDSFQ